MPDKPTIVVSWQTLLSSPVHFLAFGLGSGLSPKAPGTIGTLVALPFYGLLQYLPAWAYLLVLVLSIGMGIWLCGESSRRLGVHDHGGIVWDEFVGLWITLFLAPSGWGWLVLGFVLFRLFDIWKPWPIRYFDQHIEGGLGIMLDDILAGLAAWACLQGIAWWWQIV